MSLQGNKMKTFLMIFFIAMSFFRPFETKWNKNGRMNVHKNYNNQMKHNTLY